MILNFLLLLFKGFLATFIVVFITYMIKFSSNDDVATCGFYVIMLAAAKVV